MATYIKTLKEDNGDITYPQTKAGAVLLDNGSDLETELSQYVTAEDIASTSAITPPVQTNMIADNAVTSNKIDWTTFGNKSAIISNTITVTTSLTTLLSLTVSKTGKYFIIGNADVNTLNNALGNFGLKILNGSTELSAVYFNKPDGIAQWFMGGMTVQYMGDITAGSTIYLSAQASSNTAQISRGNLVLIRVG